MGPEVPTIELTQEQREALAGGDDLVRDSATNETYRLVRQEVYERLKALAHEDSPRTDGEMDVLAEEAGEMLDRYRP